MGYSQNKKAASKTKPTSPVQSTISAVRPKSYVLQVDYHPENVSPDSWASLDEVKTLLKTVLKCRRVKFTTEGDDIIIPAAVGTAIQKVVTDLQPVIDPDFVGYYLHLAQHE